MNFFTAAARILMVGVLTAMSGTVGAQQPYPGKPIRVIVPFASGSTLDVLARLVGQKLTEGWGQPVIVDNRPGSNGIIGTEVLAKSMPDGYTYIVVSSGHVINANLYPKLPYDAVKDFAAVATIASGELILVINPSLPANSLRDFIALAKSKPGELNYATSGSGSGGHLAAELFNIMAGVKTQHIPYKGTALATTDLIAGQVQAFFSPPLVAMPFIKSGRIRAVAVSGETRLPALPQLPTFTEAGLPGFDVKIWFGALAPAGIPRAIVERFSSEIARILAMPDIKATLGSQGMDPFTTSPEQFAALMNADTAKYAKIIKTANIKLDN
jgi:tripartite-type tricarboxylate transporter receptor subunit TctC